MNPRYSEAFLAVVVGWIVGFVLLGPGGLVAGAVIGALYGYWRIRSGG
ncbi:MAG: hypothetical protein ABEJ76_08225 [Halanaeroarchaeum sp.]